jgi:CRP/FNR family transcriptional regulator, cyclic AMP receptor protein
VSLAPEHIVPYLRPIPLFQELTDEEAMDIIRTFTTKKLVVGDTIVKENEPGDGMYVIESGEVRIHKATSQGLEEEIGKVGARSIVGELSLLDGAPRSASVTVSAAGSAYRVDRASFIVLRNGLRPAAYKVIRYLARVLCDHLRRLNATIEAFYADPQASLKKMRARQVEIRAQVAARMTGRTSRAPGPAGPPRYTGPLIAEPTSPPLPKYEPLPPRGRVSERIPFLSRVHLLEGLEDSDLQTLASVLREQKLAAGEYAFKEGGVGDGFYIIASGSFEVEKSVGQGATRTLANMPAGAVFGEISLIDGKRRSAACRATSASIVLTCSKQDFDALFNARSPFAFRFVERIAIDLAERLRAASDRFLDILSRPADVIADLERLLAEVERDVESGTDDSNDLLRMVGYRGRPSGRFQ